MRNYSQDELGALTLNSRDTISKVEKATRWPTAQLAQRCDLILETGGELGRLLPLVLAERLSAAEDESHTDHGRSRRTRCPPLDAATLTRPGTLLSIVDPVLEAAMSVQPAPIVVGGPGGFGKSVLALQVCRDERITRSFEYILWSETGQECSPARVIQLIGDLCEHLTGQRPSIASSEQAGFQLAEALGERRALLVVDNVWAAADLEPFLLGGPHCVRLVTTRNFGVCRSSSAVVQLPPMSAPEIGELLASISPVSLGEVGTGRLAELCGGWPLLASVVGASVAQDMAAGASVEAAIDRASTAIREDGPRALDVWDADQRHGTIGRAVASSLSSLDRQVVIAGCDGLGDRYLDLAIFPAAVAIPLAVLARWWQREHGWTLTGVRQFARVLAERSLLDSYRADDDTVVLHDVFRSCLLDLARRPASEIHRSLTDSFRADAADGWSTLDAGNSYAWRHLTHHLGQAGLAEEVVEVLADPDFVVQKLQSFGYEPLVDDLRALDAAAARTGPTPQVLTARVLVRSAYLASDTKRRDDIRGTLLASLSLAGHVDSSVAATLRGWESDAFDVPWSRQSTDGRDGHTGAVTSVAVGADRIVSAGEDGSVRVWDRASRRLLRVLRGHHGWVYAVALSTDGDLIASAGDDTVIRLWDASSGALRGVLTGHVKRVRSLAFDRTGNLLVSGSEDGGVLVWSTEPAARLHAMSTDGCPIWSIAVGNDDSLVAAVGEDANLRVYGLATGALLADEVAHRDWIRTVAFAATSPILATGSGDGSVSLWNVADEQVVRLRTTPVGAPVRALAVQAGGGAVRVASEDAVVRSVDADGVRTEAAMPAGVDWVRAVAQDARGLVLGCEDGALRLLRDGAVSDLAPGCDTVWSTALGPGAGFAALGRSDGAIEITSVEDGSTVRRLDAGGGRVWAVAVTADVLAAACGDGAVRVWRLRGGSDASDLVLTHDDGRAWGVALDAAGQRLAASWGVGSVGVWDLATGSCSWERAAHAGRVRSLCFDGSGDRLITGGGDGWTRSWDPAAGDRLAERHSPGWVRSVGADGRGPRVAVGLGSGDVSIHDGGTASPVHLFGHSGRVLATEFLAEDRLVSAAADGTVRLWSLHAQRQLAQVRVDATLQCASIDPATGTVLVASSTGVVLLQLGRASREA